jgi:hypothetical protein
MLGQIAKDRDEVFIVHKATLLCGGIGRAQAGKCIFEIEGQLTDESDVFRTDDFDEFPSWTESDLFPVRVPKGSVSNRAALWSCKISSLVMSIVT